jgi:hypothetical protein
MYGNAQHLQLLQVQLFIQQQTDGMEFRLLVAQLAQCHDKLQTQQI